MGNTKSKKSSRYPTGRLTLLQSMGLLVLLSLTVVAVQVLFFHAA